MLRDMVRLEKDQLSDLRAMINNANKRLTGYGHETKNLKQIVK
jgi:hypothetical protein